MSEVMVEEQFDEILIRGVAFTYRWWFPDEWREDEIEKTILCALNYSLEYFLKQKEYENE